MNSREKILSAIPRRNAPTKLPDFSPDPLIIEEPVEKFREMLRSIGGAVIDMPSVNGIREYIFQNFEPDQRIVSVIPLNHKDRASARTMHPYDDVEVTIIHGHFGVAENGAVWITDDLLPDRVLPFICQHLMVILEKENIVRTMHEAYQRLIISDYEFGTFVAGPSKTADIEQSLVLGAHGPKTMTVFLIDKV